MSPIFRSRSSLFLCCTPLPGLPGNGKVYWPLPPVPLLATLRDWPGVSSWSDARQGCYQNPALGYFDILAPQAIHQFQSVQPCAWVLLQSSLHSQLSRLIWGDTGLSLCERNPGPALWKRFELFWNELRSIVRDQFDGCSMSRKLLPEFVDDWQRSQVMVQIVHFPKGCQVVHSDQIVVAIVLE